MCSWLQVPPGGDPNGIQTDTSLWYPLGCRYLQVVFQLTYRLTLPKNVLFACSYLRVMIQMTYRLTLSFDILLVAGTCKWHSNWLTDWHSLTMCSWLQVPPGGDPTDIQRGTPVQCALGCRYLQVAFHQHTDWCSPVMCSWLQVPSGGIPPTYRLTLPCNVLLVAGTSRWRSNRHTDWHSPIMYFWLHVPPGGIPTNIQTDTPPWCPLGCRYLPLQSALGCRYLQLAFQPTYRQTHPYNVFLIACTSRWCSNWHTDRQSPLMCFKLQLLDWHSPTNNMCSWLPVPPGGVPPTYRLTLPCNVLLVAGTSVWRFNRHTQTDTPLRCVLGCRYLQVVFQLT